MRRLSIFNHVLGPVMRGPSSSHTAGAYHIACMARGLAGGTVRRATVAFDPAGSYARTFAQQGADRAFAMGLAGRPLTDDSFFTALENVRRDGLALDFQVRPLARPDHPNAMEIEIEGSSKLHLSLEARSVGGGEVEITRVDGVPVSFAGSAYELLIEAPGLDLDLLRALLSADGALIGGPEAVPVSGRSVFTAGRALALSPEARAALTSVASGASVRESPPVYLVPVGEPLFADAATMVRAAGAEGGSLGRLGLAYEAGLLGMSASAAEAEMLRRYDVMAAAAARGLAGDFGPMQLLAPSAASVFKAGAEGRLSAPGPHARAAARALAVMHVNSAMGVVCAAPTGGSAGTLPGVVLTLAEDRGLSRSDIARVLFAAGAIGLITAARATFAAEVAGCQVEIGAAGAMAAAAVVEACGGSAAQACQAAAVAYQNTMGSVCDLVQGMVEIPCHTRNAAAAASAYVCADLVLGGYANPVPLDETIDAVLAVGRLLPPELRCTARGGLALAPSAQALKMPGEGGRP